MKKPKPKTRKRRPGAGRPHTFTDVALVAVLHQFRGNFRKVAAFLEVTRTAIYNRVNDSEELQAVVKDLREGRIDDLEEGLFEAGDAREAWAICFGLKTAGRHRGYAERHEIEQKTTLTGADGGPIQHEQLAAKPEITPAALAAFLGDFGIVFDGQPDASGGDVQPDGAG